MSTEYGLTIKDFEVADDIETHPATDAWMSGDRFGMVQKIGVKYIYCLMDRSDKVKKFTPEQIGKWHGPGRSVRLTQPKITCTNDIEAVLRKPKEYYADGPVVKSRLIKPKAQVFNVGGQRISTRSSMSWKRKLAKKLIREVNQ